MPGVRGAGPDRRSTGPLWRIWPRPMAAVLMAVLLWLPLLPDGAMASLPLFYQKALLPLAKPELGLAFRHLHLLGTTLAVKQRADLRVDYYSQDSQDLVNVAQHRLGPVANRFPAGTVGLEHMPAVPPGDIYLMPSLSGPFGMVAVQSPSINVIIGAAVNAFMVGDVRTVLGSLILGGQEASLLLQAADLSVFILTVDGDLSRKMPVALAPGQSSMPPSLAMGVGPAFHLLYNGVHLETHMNTLATGVNPLGLAEDVVHMATGRLLTAASAREDMIFLLSSGRILVCLDRAFSEASCAQVLDIPPVPGLTVQSAMRILIPGSLTDTALHRHFFLHCPVQKRLFRFEFLPATGLASNVPREILIPQEAWDMGLSMIRVRHSPGGSAWHLAAKHLYFPPEAFGCPPGDDSTVACADGLLQASGGWGCATGRDYSPLFNAAYMCYGCQGGRQFIPSASGPGICQECPVEHCAACMGSTCLVCEGGLHLQRDWRTGQTSCQPTCSMGLSRHGTMCLPPAVLSAPAVALNRMALKLPVNSGRVVTVTPTRLDLRSNNQLFIRSAPPTPADPGALLIGDSLGDLFWAMPDLSNGGWLVRQVQTGQSLAGVKTSLLEVGPFDPTPGGLNGSWPVYMLAFCRADRVASIVRVACQPDAEPPPGPGLPPSACPPTFIEIWHSTMTQGCGIRSMAADALTLLDEDATLPAPQGQAMAIWLDDTGIARVQTLSSQTSVGMHPVLFPASGGVLMAGGARTLYQPAPRLYLVPVPLSANDPRAEALIEAWSGAGSFVEPLSLPTGRASWPFETVASILQLGAGPVWDALHWPLGTLPHERLIGLPALKVHLATLEGGSYGNGHRLGVVPLAGLDYPSALVLVTQRHVLVSLLRCWDHHLSGFPFCHLLPATSLQVDLIEDLRDIRIVHLPMARASGDPPGQVHLLLSWGASTPVGLSLTPPEPGCPPGTFPPNCLPCWPSCPGCTGPGLADCQACDLQMPDGTCVQECPPGLVDSGLGACACPALCVACSPDTLGGPFWCRECQAGHALDSLNPNSCLPCHPSCESCAVPNDPAACHACPAAKWLKDHTCVDDCPTSFWPNPASRACEPCPASCATCASADRCTACPARAYLGSDDQCHHCDGSCASCEDGLSCGACRSGLVFLQTDPLIASTCASTCPPGEFVGAGRCTVCGSTCDLCAGGPDRCEVCAPGHRWQTGPPAAGGTAACVPCPPGCESCAGELCLSCGPGLFLTPTGTCAASCPGGRHADDEVGSCQPCDVSCDECAGPAGDQCTECAPGLDMVAEADGLFSCASGCPEGRYRDTVSGSCEACDPACATCNGPSDRDCWRCTGGLLQDGHSVQQCAANHAPTAGRCLPCHASCAACAGTRSTDCVGCLAGLLPLPAGASPTRCVPGCPVGYTAGPGGCTPCGVHCSSCPGDAATCALCDRGWLLSGPACQDSCPEASAPQGGLCKVCHATCATCFGPEPEHCLTCQPPARLLLDGRCYASCPGGTFESGPTCLPCHATCGACTGPTGHECTACPEGRLLRGGECLTACPTGEYADMDRVCRPCDAPCRTCLGPGACSSCAGEQVLHEDQCIGACPERTYVCSVTGRCRACPAGCAACMAGPPSSGAECTATCTECDAGRALSPAGGRCVEVCPAGEHLDGSVCRACHADCRTCFGRASACTSCHAGVLHPANGACVGACPAAGFVEVDFSASVVAPGPERVCLSCSSGCLQCVASPTAPACGLAPDGALVCPTSASICTFCQGDLLLVAGRAECVAACPPVGFFADWHAPAPACLPCHPACASCLGPGPGDCTDAGGPAGRRLALGLGIGLGMLLLLLLLLLVLFLYLRLRHRRRVSTKPVTLRRSAAPTCPTLPDDLLAGLPVAFAAAGWGHLGALCRDLRAMGRALPGSRIAAVLEQPGPGLRAVAVAPAGRLQLRWPGARQAAALPEVVSILAGTVHQDRTLLLACRGPGRPLLHIQLPRDPGQAPVLTPVAGSLSEPGLRASVGQGPAFHVAHAGRHVRVDAATGAAAVMPPGRRAIRQVLPTRLASAEPLAEDLVLLLEDRAVRVCLGWTPAGGCAAGRLDFRLPAGAPAAGHFLNPPAPALPHRPLGFLLYLDPGAREVWRVDLAEGAAAVARAGRLVLPGWTGARAARPGLLHMHAWAPAPHGPIHWYLTEGRNVFRQTDRAPGLGGPLGVGPGPGPGPADGATGRPVPAEPGQPLPQGRGPGRSLPGPAAAAPPKGVPQPPRQHPHVQQVPLGEAGPPSRTSSGAWCRPCDAPRPAHGDAQPRATPWSMARAARAPDARPAACPAGSYPDPAGCRPCDVSCLRCGGPAPGQCTACSMGMYFTAAGPAAGACHACDISCLQCAGPGASACTACRDGAHFDDGHTGVGTCVPCDESCHQCRGPAADQCTACGPGRYLAPGPAGPGPCRPCHDTCLQCAGPGAAQCTSCPANSAMSAGACVAACQDNEYTGHVPGVGRVCMACDPACVQCFGPGPEACSACPGGLLADRGLCVSQCTTPESMACRAAGRCGPCPGRCAECVAAIDSLEEGCIGACTACHEGYFLHGDACGDDCPEGTLACAGARLCVARPAGCLDFDLAPAPGQPCAAACSRCAGERLLLHGACVAACPEGFFPDPGVDPACRPCHPDCQHCSGPGEDQCLDPSGRLSFVVSLSVGISLLVLLLTGLTILFFWHRSVRRRTSALKPGPPYGPQSVAMGLVPSS
ncbi:hypothetical protein H696_03244 [Fonticula alba]|uniref:EGF-like domain-containing protein n=1 Tax=Fonticula alba TaxID=691883 RepID=A0A058Z678_FONAL|nr:hypothetical protein H696_03244 [Fonticula alba]KCV69799.1 hypothetical protein H696_03244 [Fonticula alba]|eukprot:XP_009495405.1 hypothetical protein H696_03244 [Fonticula alba]